MNRPMHAGIIRIGAGELMQALAMPDGMELYDIRLVPNVVGTVELTARWSQFRPEPEGAQIPSYRLDDVRRLVEGEGNEGDL